MSRLKHRAVLGAIVTPLLHASITHAAVFASTVVSYTAGALSAGDAQYNNPASAVTTPTGITGASAGYPGVVSAFNPAFDTNQLVEIGTGGHLTLKFSQPVTVGVGKALGIFTNTGLVDVNYPSEQAGSPATVLGGGDAKVRISANGTTWYDVGLKNFKIPENFYTNADAYATTAPTSPQLADFGKPFAGGLAAFNGEDYAQIEATLTGSAGGRWFDLEASKLTQFSYVKITEPATLAAGSHLGIVAVSAANGHTGVITPSFATAAPVPLPSAAMLGLAGLVGVLAISRRAAF